MTKPTKPQLRMLKTIAPLTGKLREMGLADATPTRRAVQAALKLRSPNAVTSMLPVLVAAGWLSQGPRLRLTTAGELVVWCAGVSLKTALMNRTQALQTAAEYDATRTTENLLNDRDLDPEQRINEAVAAVTEQLVTLEEELEEFRPIADAVTKWHDVVGYLERTAAPKRVPGRGEGLVS